MLENDDREEENEKNKHELAAQTQSLQHTNENM